MKRSLCILVLFLSLGTILPASASQRLIVRDVLGINVLSGRCFLLGCNVVGGLGDPLGQLFLVTVEDMPLLNVVLGLVNQIGIAHVEIDQNTNLFPASGNGIPDALRDRTPVDYYGTTVWHGYINQPAFWIVRAGDTHDKFGVKGSGIVAMIDTGVDANHPALKAVVVPGYDFINNANDGNESGGVNQSTAGVLDGGPGASQQIGGVNQSTAGVLDGGPTSPYVTSDETGAINQSTAGVLDGGPTAAYGHGTMTAGVVHMIAPGAKIMPLKSFKADGTGYISDVLRAIYFAGKNGANVLSMSFSFYSPSSELNQAINYVSSRGMICVASAGNDGKKTVVYPAAIKNVMGVASTNDMDQRSSFSNYGNAVVWVAAPGEQVITTYPDNRYASVSGTSFSAPFVSGTAALLLDVSKRVNQSYARDAIGHAVWVSGDLNHGRLNTYTAVESLKHRLGIR